MRDRRRLPVLLLPALAVACLAGCVSGKPLPPADRPAPAAAVSAPAPPKPAHRPGSPAAAPTPAPSPTASPFPASYASGMAALREGKFENALELFAAALKEKPGSAEISRRFDEALAGLKSQADAAYTQGKPEIAGRRWMGALRFIDLAAARGRNRPSVRAEVQAHLERLTGEQMEKGLISYRKGDLPAAIAAWKTILAYDPGNEEASRAVRTASIQLENLRKLPYVN